MIERLFMNKNLETTKIKNHYMMFKISEEDFDEIIAVLKKIMIFTWLFKLPTLKKAVMKLG
jgi:hypothetical protein